MQQKYANLLGDGRVHEEIPVHDKTGRVAGVSYVPLESPERLLGAVIKPAKLSAEHQYYDTKFSNWRPFTRTFEHRGQRAYIMQPGRVARHVRPRLSRRLTVSQQLLKQAHGHIL